MKKWITLLCLALALTACSSDTEKQAPEKEAVEEVKDTVVSFVGVGDNLIHDSIYKEADRLEGEAGDGKYSFMPMYEQVADDIEKADLAFINQETILGGDERGLSGYPSFNTPQDMADDVEALGFDIVNTATNHSLDMGFAGIQNSSEVWNNKTDMIMAGTYVSQEDRDTIRTIERKGITFAFLAYTYGTNGIEPPNSYCVAYFDEAQIREDVAKAKECSDVVIVSAHWGIENEHMPSDEQKYYAQLFADLGVDVVIGTHPHVIQPIEWLEGESGNRTLVTYSLGNFLGGMLYEDNILSGMISFDFIKKDGSEDITVEHVVWTPLVISFEGDADDIMESRHNYRIYKLSDYSEDMAAKHALNGYEGQTITAESLWNTTKEVIDEAFLQ